MCKLISVTLSGLLVSSAILSSAFSLPLYGQTTQGITVAGKASVNAVPDKFTLSMTVSERNKLADKAKLNVDHKVSLLIEQIEKLGVEKNNINAMQLNIWPIYSQVKPKVREVYSRTDNGVAKVELSNEVQYPNIIAFNVSRVLTIKLDDIAQYETILNKASKVGVSHISGVQREVSNTAELYQQALAKAVVNAKQKAHALAKELNVSLGQATALTEMSHYSPVRRMKAMEAQFTAASPDTYVGTSSIQAEVNVTFAINEQ